ncbi:leucyl aminopeptidase [Minwuia thermotolerans]|uniref:Probable cytosol aminopeptidase n=1 Tax=Minwuia thermotolerans TaxID=2056226 RepID=A0A2M9FZG0_9PROT|nr:leucyl aminopeptidase [Minwuia thermotolerans]PJK28857.1 leucyl aminopeptidase [Minwuia thermotolerans]
MDISISGASIPGRGVVVVGVAKDGKLTPAAKALDEKTEGAIRQVLRASRFTGASGQSQTIAAPRGTRLDLIVLLGLGETKSLSSHDLELIGGRAFKAVANCGAKQAKVIIDAEDLAAKSKLTKGAAQAHIAMGARLASYRFDHYHTKLKDEDKPSLEQLAIGARGAAAARDAFAALDKVVDGVFLTRDLVSEPANILYPATLADRCQELTKLGVKVEVLGEAQMKKLGMGALVGVGQGSEKESRLVVMQWNGGAKNDKPIAFVGKGVTFDTGGISIKPAAGMEDMKWDMGGSAAVIGAMAALAGRQAKANVIGVVGLVENMPDGNAQRPGDVVTSMSGQTIEVLNTDAEGRLVLCDALWYTQDRFKPEFMINLATLTGAVIISLGDEYAGLFSNNDRLATRLMEAGEAVDEKLWRFPLHKNYDKKLKSDIADMRNIGNARGAGSITAAQFLQRFVNDVPWAHLDIAGVTWSSSARPTTPKGGTGFGVRVLDELVRRHYESK